MTRVKARVATEMVMAIATVTATVTAIAVAGQPESWVQYPIPEFQVRRWRA